MITTQLSIDGSPLTPPLVGWSLQVYMDGTFQVASIYDRAKLLAGNLVEGPAVITEMDSTTLVLSDCQAEIHDTGVILIRPRPEAPAPAIQNTVQPPAAAQNTQDAKVRCPL